MFGFVPTLRVQALSEMFLIAIVKVIGVPDGNEVPLSGFTVTSMSESVQAVPLAVVDGLAEADELAVAVGVGLGDGAAVGVGSEEHDLSSMKKMMSTTRTPRPTRSRRRQ